MTSNAFLRPIRVYSVRPYNAEQIYYLLEMFMLHRTKTDSIEWLPHHLLSVSIYKMKLQSRMYRLNKREGVPTLQGLKHGSMLTRKQFAKLADAGLLDCTKITLREGKYVVS